MKENEIRKYFVEQFKDAPNDIVEQLGESIFGSNLVFVSYDNPELEALIIENFNKEFKAVHRNKYANRRIRKYIIQLNNSKEKITFDKVLEEIASIEKQVKELNL